MENNLQPQNTRRASAEIPTITRAKTFSICTPPPTPAAPLLRGRSPLISRKNRKHRVIKGEGICFEAGAYLYGMAGTKGSGGAH